MTQADEARAVARTARGPTVVATPYYTPQYYHGYVVYYDDVGRPTYYVGGRRYYIAATDPYYNGYVVHYGRYRTHYHRWHRSPE